ncbi:MAG TPA: LPP20 family lipoprotein, partial [Agitococcus sp.]|nr:LPP20 family lipoprotein [Agitococcus sp.]
MKKVFLFVLLFSVGKVLADSYPHWVNSPPASANNHLYAVGMSPLTISIAQSISAATANAKTEIISQLRANISGKTDTNNTSIINKSQIQENFSSRNFYNQSTVINTEAKNISGISIVETYVDRDNKSVFALADFDYIKAIADLKNRYSECDNEIKMIDSTLSSF